MAGTCSFWGGCGRDYKLVLWGAKEFLEWLPKGQTVSCVIVASPCSDKIARGRRPKFSLPSYSCTHCVDIRDVNVGGHASCFDSPKASNTSQTRWARLDLSPGPVTTLQHYFSLIYKPDIYMESASFGDCTNSINATVYLFIVPAVIECVDCPVRLIKHHLIGQVFRIGIRIS